MSRVRVNGVLTHYQRLRPSRPGPAPTVVCVHGLGYDSLASFYLTLAEPLRAAGVDVLTYDLRGHGRSERPPTGYLLEDFVDDLVALLDHLELDRPVHLVGNSYGGTVAFALAARHPERVASIMAIESEPPTASWSDKMTRTWRNVIEAMQDDRTIEQITEVFGPHYARLTRIAETILSSTTIVEEVAAGRPLGPEDLDRITCPVLAVLGSDGFQSDDLLAVESLLPDCSTQIVADQNHSVLVERHHEVRALLIAWLIEHGTLADGAAQTSTTDGQRVGVA